MLMLFPVVLALYYAMKERSRWVLLLITSCLLYAFVSPGYILLMFVWIIVSYALTCSIEGSKSRKKKKQMAFLSILLNLSLLIAFRYFNFFSENVWEAAQYFHLSYTPTFLNLAAPVGISFLCLRSISYTVDVYRGTKSAEHHLGRFALYILFFPQLLEGPIERSKSFISQLYWPHKFYARYVTHGLFLMLWGFFKSFVVADKLSMFVDPVFNSPLTHNGVDFVAAAALFSFQIYYLLSGFADIAYGCAKCFGYHTVRNFNRPYLALSIYDFWKRWNISVFHWFKDYVWKPIGGNAFIALVLLGLWHGASWNLVFWGALHGLYLSVYFLSTPIRHKLTRSLRLRSMPFFYRMLRRLLTFAAVSFAWIFFRSSTLADAFYITMKLGDGWERIALGSWMTLAGLFCLIFAIEVMQWINRNGKIRSELFQKPAWVRYSLYYGLILVVILFGRFDFNLHTLGGF